MISNVTYVRWKRGQSRRGRAFPPPSGDHPAFNSPCALCSETCGTDVGGEAGLTLLVMGPDPESQTDWETHNADRWYSAMAVLTHTACMTKHTDGELHAVVTQLHPVEGDPT